MVGAGLRVAGWWLVAASGLVSVGVGDAAASVAGRLAGRRRLHVGTRKTWEGTVAGAAAMLACQAAAAAAGAVLAGGWEGVGVGARAAAAWRCVPRGLVADVAAHTVLSAGLEALTDQLDNLVVPLWHTTWMLLALAWHQGKA